MANKIAQITIGDVLFIQLDANPSSDGIGYNAPVGSLAVFQSPGGTTRNFIKVDANPQHWHRFDQTWNFGGNDFWNSAIGTLGSKTGVNKDVQFIRNGLETLRFIENPDADFFGADVSILNDKLRIFNHTSSNDKFFNNSLILSNAHLSETPNESDRTSIMYLTRGLHGIISELGAVIGVGPIDNPIDPNEFVLQTQIKTGRGILNKLITGASTPFIMPTMNDTSAKILFADVTILIRNVSDNKISQRSKRIAIKCTSFVDKTYSAVFTEDSSAYFESDTFDFTLTFSNSSDTHAPAIATNTYKPTVNITGLTIGQTFDISVWMDKKSMEDNN